MKLVIDLKPIPGHEPVIDVFAHLDQVREDIENGKREEGDNWHYDYSDEGETG